LKYGSIRHRPNSRFLLLAGWRRGEGYAELAAKFGAAGEVARRFGRETAPSEKRAQRELNAREKWPHPARLGKGDRLAIGLKYGAKPLTIRGRHDVPA
jgi:hypothetical protein